MTPTPEQKKAALAWASIRSDVHPRVLADALRESEARVKALEVEFNFFKHPDASIRLGHGQTCRCWACEMRRLTDTLTSERDSLRAELDAARAQAQADRAFQSENARLRSEVEHQTKRADDLAERCAATIRDYNSARAEVERMEKVVKAAKDGLEKLEGYCLVSGKQYGLNECGHDECVRMILRVRKILKALAALDGKEAE